MGKILTHWSVAFLTVFAIAYFSWSNNSIVQIAKLKAFDWQLQNETVYQEENLAYVTIGEKAIEANGQWPWPRDKIADLIWTLREQGAGIIVLPMLFSEPDRFGKDPELLDALIGNGVVIAQTGSLQRESIGIFRPVNMVGGNKDASNNLFTYKGMLPPIFDADGVGVINTAPEIDGVVRRVPLLINIQGNLYPNIAVETLRVMVNAPTYSMKTTPYGIDSIRVKGFPIKRGIIKTDDRARLFLRWNTEIDTYDYLRNDLSGLGGRTVVVGIIAEGLANPLATPIGEKYPHEVIGATLSTIIAGETISRPIEADLYELAGIVVLGALTILIAAALRYGLVFCYIVVTGAGIFYLVTYLFSTYLWLIDPTMPILMLTLVGLHAIFNRFVREFTLKQQIKKQFGTYLSPDLVAKLQKNPELLKLGGETRDLSIMFTDIRGFTNISEHYGEDVQGLTKLINRYMTAMTKEILNNNGTLDKYIGDAQMAFWNAPLDNPNHAKDSVKTGLAMLKSLEEFNIEIEPEGIPAFGMGLGINSDDVVVGNMGSDQRFDYTCLGDGVNTAARLEGQSKNYAVKIIIGPKTAAAVENDYTVLELDNIAVKGKTQGTKIYTVIESREHEVAKEQHEIMHAKYRGQEFEAVIAFCKTLKNSFDGELTGYYDMWIERCEELMEQDLPNDWDGIFRATSK